jgi:[protein-PII] uridylyltransferase
MDFSQPVSVLKQRVSESRSSVIGGLHGSWPGLALGENLTGFYDGIIDQVWRESVRSVGTEENRFCVLGLGSYGRVELNTGSDIDLTFLYESDRFEEKQAVRQVVQRIVRTLWDIGLEIGHTMRTPEEAISMCIRDCDIRTSYLEARPVAGDRTWWMRVREMLEKRAFGVKPTEFIAIQLQRMAKRHEGYAGSQRMAEPNIKEGPGGLRDVHTVLWIVCSTDMVEDEVCARESRTAAMIRKLAAKGFLSHARCDEMLRSFDYLLHVRNQMHMEANRKTDVLNYPAQAAVASRMGYRDEQDDRAVELFMRDYYVHVKRLGAGCRLILRKIESRAQAAADPTAVTKVRDGFYMDGRTEPPTLRFEGDFAQAILERPTLMLSAFRTMVEHSAVLSSEVEVAIQEGLHLIDDEFVNSLENAHVFLDLWKYEGRVSSVLWSMYELGVLERYLPEFAFIGAHYHRNIYHRYTTDEHLLIALKHVEALFYVGESESDSLRHIKTVYDELSLFEKRQLFWAVFLHDIGKSRGVDHCLEGVRVAEGLFDRLHNEEDRPAVLFLIANHLRMEQAAFRRNLKDPDTIQSFGELVCDRRRLRMLYLLTYADMSAANVHVWTEWKGILLKELFLKTDTFLRSARPDSTELSFDWEEAPRQVPIPENTLSVSFNDLPDFTEVLVVTTDRPYRLSQICGAMALSDVSILEAFVETRSDGWIVDEFRVVTFPGHRALSGPEKDALRARLERVLQAGQDLTEDMRKLRLRWKRRRVTSEVEDEIHFDDNRCFTIIDVFTRDRIGLLFLITRTLSDLGLNIHAAKIGTRLDGVADCFYVLGPRGEKITSRTTKETIRQKLLLTLSGNAL